MKIAFDNHELTVAITALRVAAERYDEHAKTLEAYPGHGGMRDQFRKQREDANELALKLEEHYE